MRKIGDFDSERNKLLKEARKLISEVQGVVGVEKIDNLKKAVDTLWELRRVCYENLNQIQHDVMILQAAKWIEANYYREKNIEWCWNPRQTGSSRGAHKKKKTLIYVVRSQEKLRYPLRLQLQQSPYIKQWLKLSKS